MKPRTYKKNQVLEVTWFDIMEYTDWVEEEVAGKKELPTCNCVGYFLNIKNDTLRISCSLGMDKERNVMVLPWGAIKNIRKLQ